MKRELNEWDMLKVMAILCVVIGHVTIQFTSDRHPEQNTFIPQVITYIIYLFHMPLFMAISGAIYQVGAMKGKYDNFSKFIVNKGKRLLVPYLFVGFVFLFPVLNFLQYGTINCVDISKAYDSLVLCHDTRHLWYLIALFWIFIFHYLMKYFKIPDWILLIGSIILALIASVWKFPDLFCVNMAIGYYPYFLLGIILAQKHGTIKSLILSIVCVFICSIIIYLQDLYVIDRLCSLLMTIGIVIMIVTCCRRFMKDKKSLYLSIKSHPLFLWLLDYSFVIYLFHEIVVMIYHKITFGVHWGIVLVSSFILSIVVSIIIGKTIRSIMLNALIGEKRVSYN